MSKKAENFYFNLFIFFIIAFGFILMPNSSFGATLTGADVPLTKGDWVHFALWKLDANGLTGPIFLSSRPYGRKEIAEIITGIRLAIKNGRIRPRSHELRLIEKMEEEFSGEIESEGVDFRILPDFEADYSYSGSLYKLNTPNKLSLSLWGAVSYHPTPNVTFYEEVDIGRYREVLGSEGKTASQYLDQWKWDYTADFRRAYVQYQGKHFDVLLGRDFLYWGPGYSGSLIISDNSPAFDMILLNGKFGPVRATAFTAMLDKMWNDRREPDYYRYLANRYLSGHRIDWLVNERLELGLSEVVLFGGEARNLEIKWINPLIPYYATQWNTGEDNNILVSADFVIKPISKLSLYGQFLVDDFNYVDTNPNSLGYIGGFYISDPLGLSGTDLRAEYTRIDTWTYTHRVPENQYTHFGWIIGNPLGPDADQILLELSQMLGMDFRLKLMYTFVREGSNTVVDRFRGENYKQMDFPSEAVEHRRILGLQLSWERVKTVQMNILWQGFLIENEKKDDDFLPNGELKILIGYLFDLNL